MNAADPQTPPLTAREISKQRNRAALLQAAIRAIHQHGLKGATIDVIQKYSGLGRGMINQHFDTKDRLIWAVAEQLMATYRDQWQTALTQGGRDPAAQLHSLLAAEFSPEVLNPQTAAIWFAFRAEVSADPEYQRLIGQGDAEFSAALTQVCSAIAQHTGHPARDADLAGRVLSALIEGLWTEFHLAPDSFDRTAAHALCLDVAEKYLGDLRA